MNRLLLPYLKLPDLATTLKLQYIRFGLVAFISGFVVMSMEMVGARLIAPYLGTTITVWAALIGIILASLALGYWGGGRLADRFPKPLYLGAILFLSAILTVLLPLVAAPVLPLLGNASYDLRLRALIAGFILFAPATICLGMVSPYLARLQMKEVNESGQTVGRLSALATTGSIVGTVFTAFFLITWLGSNNILFLLAGLLILASFIAVVGRWRTARLLVMLFAFALIPINLGLGQTQDPNGLIDQETAYSRVWIYPRSDPYSGYPIRVMSIGHEFSSAMFLHSDDLVLPYTKYYRLDQHFIPGFRRVLMLGGAAYSYPKDFLLQYPQASMDVVEIDPGVSKLAQEFFHLPTDPRLKIYTEDARTFLNRAPAGEYDVIYGDTFRSSIIPFQLTTKEAVQKMYDTLHADGVALINVISSREGANSKFLRAEYRTYKSVFPQVYALPVQDFDAQEVQNYMIIALKSNKPVVWQNPNPELDRLLKHYKGVEPAEDLPILTDQFAPVESYTMGIAS